MPSKKPMISIRVEPEEYEKLQIWAEEEYRTLSGLVTAIVRKALDDKEKEAKK